MEIQRLQLGSTLFILLVMLQIDYGDCNCGYELNGTEGAVTSPNYTESEKYPAKVNCIWFRRGNYSLYTQIQVMELDVEPGPNGSNLSCNYDYLQVSFLSSRRSFRFCGSFAPHEVYEGQGHVRIRFFSDDSVTFKGFKLRYNITENYTRCFPNPCLNGGECLENIYGVGCNCSAGFSGRNCEQEILPCDSNPCYNRGICENILTNKTFLCTCQEGWGGLLCQTATGCLNPGLHQMSRNKRFSHHIRIKFSCKKGFGLKGVTHITCLTDNTWDSSLPVCQALVITSRKWNSTFTTVISILVICFLLTCLLLVYLLLQKPTEVDDDNTASSGQTLPIKELSSVSSELSKGSWSSNYAVYNFEIR